MTLQEFLGLPHQFRWGGVAGDDCTTFCGTWLLESVGVDPAEACRGTYSTAEGAHDILARAGGLVAFAAAALEPLGFARTDDPQDGDVSVVLAPSGMDGVTEICVVRFGPLWALPAPSGVIAKKLDHVAAWRAPDRGTNEFPSPHVAAALWADPGVVQSAVAACHGQFFGLRLSLRSLPYFRSYST